MPEDEQARIGKKEKEKPRAKKVIGNVKPSEEPEAREPGRPTYEHG